MWSCHACAETNGNGRATCFACGEPRPEDRSGAVIGGPSSAMTRRERIAEQEAAYRSERHVAMQELGLRSSLEDGPSNRYDGVMSEHAVSAAWHAATDTSSASTRIKVEFPVPIGPAGLVVSHRPVFRPFVTRLDHEDGSSRYVGAITPAARSRWLTPDRAAVVSSSVAIRITRRYLGLAEPGLLPTIVVVSHVKGLVEDASRLA